MSRARSLVLTASISLLASSHHSALSQNSPAPHPLILTIEAFKADSPVKVISITLGSTPLKPGAPVPMDGHLLRDLTITLQNTSNQPIVEAGLSVIGLSSDPNSVKAANAQTFLGRYPAAALFRKDGSPIASPAAALKEPILIQPGDTMTFKFGPDSLAYQAQFDEIASGGGTLMIQPASFFFANGARWGRGGYLAPGDSAGKWLPISADKFKSM